MVDIRGKLVGLCEAFNAHDLDRIMMFFADDCVLEMPRGPHAWGVRLEGKQAVRKGLASRFEGLPNVHYGNEEHFMDADRQTGMSKWTLTGTTREGRRLEVRGCDFYTFRDDQVTRKDSTGRSSMAVRTGAPSVGASVRKKSRVPVNLVVILL